MSVLELVKQCKVVFCHLSDMFPIDIFSVYPYQSNRPKAEESHPDKCINSQILNLLPA